jgi:glucosyl-dolichyl phosphate glucuronosyltransferase
MKGTSMRASVIIPTRGRPVAIKQALRSLLDAGASNLGVEVLVVDNNVDDALGADLRLACEQAGEPVRYLAEPAPGQTAARHCGARQARGEILIYVDDDVQVSDSWFKAIFRAFEDKSIGIVGGPSVPVFAGSVPAWLWDFVEPSPYGGWWCGWLSLLDIGRDIHDIDPTWIWGLNFSIRRQALFDLGGFHPDLVPSDLQRWQGDGETGLSLRAKAAGVRAAFRQDILLHHHIGADRVTPGAFAKRAYYQGICDSFTRIRQGTDPSPTTPGPMGPRPEDGRWSGAAREVRAATVVAYNEGWMFHQREAAGDAQLLAWVRRPDFWSADIRDQVRAAASASNTPA